MYKWILWPSSKDAYHVHLYRSIKDNAPKLSQSSVCIFFWPHVLLYILFDLQEVFHDFLTHGIGYIMIVLQFSHCGIP